MIALIVDGIILGSILSLGAVSLTLVYGIVRFANFAPRRLDGRWRVCSILSREHGLRRVGHTDVHLRAAFIRVADAARAPVGYARYGRRRLDCRSVVFRPMRQRRYATVMFVIGSLAVAFALRALLFIIWGPEFHFFHPGPASGSPASVRGSRQA